MPAPSLTQANLAVYATCYPVLQKSKKIVLSPELQLNHPSTVLYVKQYAQTAVTHLTSLKLHLTENLLLWISPLPCSFPLLPRLLKCCF